MTGSNGTAQGCRVIHRDGRVGTTNAGRRIGNPDYGAWFEWTDGEFSYRQNCVNCGDLRPLGPVEEELLRCASTTAPRDFDPLAFETKCELLGLCLQPEGWVERIDEALSELLEACVRIHEQHGECL